MKIMSNKFYAIIAAGFFASILAASAQAQWTIVGNPKTDKLGNITLMNEKHRNGSFKITSRQYFAGTHVMMTERVTTFDPTGNIVSIISERRDKLNRTTFLSNEVKNNRGVWNKFRQTITYRSDRDRTGLTQGQRWDPASRRWINAL